MSLATFCAALCSALMLTHCTGIVPTIGEQSERQELYTSDPVPLAFAKSMKAVALEHALVQRSDPQAGTIQATAYQGKVTVLMLIESSRGQTRVQALARTAPGTFSQGKLDLAERILARYGQGDAS
jgi:hypothetical protein